MKNPPFDWNRKWLSKQAEPLSPDTWLIKVLPLLPQGPVLDLACGQGRNALFLAEQGFAVTAVDLSGVALERLREEAERRRLELTLRQLDLETLPSLGRASFAAVIDFFFLQRSLFPAIKEALQPGGVAVVRTFSRAGDFPGGLQNPDFVLERGELPELFRGWDVLLHEEGLEPSRKGGGLAGIVVRKPLS